MADALAVIRRWVATIGATHLTYRPVAEGLPRRVGIDHMLTLLGTHRPISSAVDSFGLTGLVYGEVDGRVVLVARVTDPVCDGKAIRWERLT